VSPDAPRRLSLLAGAVLVVVGISIADAVVPAKQPGTPTPHSAAAVVADASASSSVWYCPGPAAAPQGSQAALLLTNAGPRAVTGMLHLVTPGGAASAQQLLVPPATQLSLPVPPAAVEVLLQGGAVGVVQQVSGPLGASAAPCNSSTSSTWYFGHGSTAGGAALQVALFNPLPTPAVVDLSFLAPAGSPEVVPPAYQGIPLAAGAVLVENVADHVPGNGSLAAVVDALSGSVVATEMQEAGNSPNSGMSLVDGADRLGAQWSFAANANAPGLAFTVVNPTGHGESVTAAIALVQGRATPLTMEVPAQSSVTLASQGQTRIPPGAIFAITFTADGRGGIVAARQVAGGTPFPQSSLSAGTPGGVSRWLVPPMPPGQLAGDFAIVGLSTRIVHVTIVEIDPSGRQSVVAGQRGVALVPGAMDFVLSPGGSLSVGARPVIVEADGPIALQLDPAPTGTPGGEPVALWPLSAAITQAG
jgi:hypothetical protein